MTDQAKVLRGLVETRLHQPEALFDPPRARTITITSGKGGVGKSVIAVNLAVALRQAGHSVCVLDANPGLGNVDLLCGLNGYWNLSHVVTGARRLDEILLDGPAGIHVLPGASELNEVAESHPTGHREFFAQLNAFEQTYDFLVIDAGTGVHRTMRPFVSDVSSVLVVTTPEPTSIADSYAVVKSLVSVPDAPSPEILVNWADDADQARGVVSRIERTTHGFLRAHVAFAGWIPNDPEVPASVFRREPFLLINPYGPASRAVAGVARRLIHETRAYRPEAGFFSKFHTSETAAA